MSTITRAVPAKPAAAFAAVVIPEALPAASRSWRKLITAVDGTRRGAYALEGHWLDAGAAYELPAGALVIACDVVGTGCEVVLWRAETGGLVEVHTWSLKGRIGKRATDYTARRLAEDARAHRARRLEALANRWEGWCRSCRNLVPAGAGTWAEAQGVRHLPGQCLPPPPPPEEIRPNRYGEPCLLCGGWVAPGEGAALLLSVPQEGRRYRAAHDTCPAVPVPGPANRSRGWCRACREVVEPGQGYWFDGLLHHCVCPEARPEPTWIVRRRGHDVGDIARFDVDLRGGPAVVVDRDGYYRTRGRDDNPPVPAATPGYRVHSATYVSMVGVVLETVRGRCRVRAATLAEAEAVLAREASRVVLPAPGQPARWGTELFSPGNPKQAFRMMMRAPIRAWLAELTGLDPDYRFQREFLRPDYDYTHADAVGSRGVTMWWTLHANRVYEARYWESWQSYRRVFLRVADGQVTEIDRKEAEAWLVQTAAWIAS